MSCSSVRVQGGADTGSPAPQPLHFLRITHAAFAHIAKVASRPKHQPSDLDPGQSRVSNRHRLRRRGWGQGRQRALDDQGTRILATQRHVRQTRTRHAHAGNVQRVGRMIGQSSRLSRTQRAVYEPGAVVSEVGRSGHRAVLRGARQHRRRK